MRQMFIMNRTKRRQEKKYVEETGQPLLRFSKKNNCLLCQTIKIVWGKSRRQSQFSSSWGKFFFFSILPLKKVASMSAMKNTTKAILFPSSSVWLEKKERGKVAKQEEKMASLLLTILDSSQGGSKNPQSLPLPCIMTSLWALSLKSNVVPCMQILGPFGPPKKYVNFDMSKKHQKCVLCILTSNHFQSLLLPYCVLFNKWSCKHIFWHLFCLSFQVL